MIKCKFMKQPSDGVKVKDHLENLSEDGRMILNFILLEALDVGA